MEIAPDIVAIKSSGGDFFDQVAEILLNARKPSDLLMLANGNIFLFQQYLRVYQMIMPHTSSFF